MKILLVKCPRSCKSHFAENSESLALAYLAAVLRQHRFTVVILDAALHGLSLEDIIREIMRHDSMLIGFTIADTTFIKTSIEVITRLRKHDVTAHITMGGHTPTFHYADILSMCEGIDSIVMHEGEMTIVELAQMLKEGLDWKQIDGIAFRTVSGIRSNRARRLIGDIGTIPFPARDTLPYVLREKKGDGVALISGGRGCPMNCGFCSIRSFYSACGGPHWRIRSNCSIIDEIEHLVRTFGVQEIILVDDIFVGPGQNNSRRVLEFADEIEKRELRVMLSIAERVDNIECSLFERLREIGVRNILIGIESGNQKLLDYFGKGIRIEHIRTAVAVLRDLDIGITASFINFTPFTTVDQLRDDLSFYESLQINVLQGLLNRFQYYNGTPLGQKLLRENRVQGSFPEFVCLSTDHRVNTVYDIAQRCLGTFLAMAEQLNRIARKLRLRVFWAERHCRSQLPLLQTQMSMYNRCVIAINYEAIELLRQVVDHVDTADSWGQRELDRYCGQLLEISLAKYNEWDRMLNALQILGDMK